MLLGDVNIVDEMLLMTVLVEFRSSRLLPGLSYCKVNEELEQLGQTP